MPIWEYDFRMARAATTTDAFNAVAEPRRRQLLELLAQGEKPVNELVGMTDLTQPVVSKHLRVLRDIGLVTSREEGQHRYYRLDPEPLVPVDEWVGAFLGVIDGNDAPATTAWTPDGRSVSVRRGGAAGRTTVEVGAELGRVMAEASHRASAAFAGAHQGWERVVDRSLRRRGRRGEGDGDVSV